jgi:ubiquinone biosynthesis protein COQ9
MKGIFVSYNQAHTLLVNELLDELGIRGFTRWSLTEGRGSVDGEPHYGSHAWPSMNSSLLVFVEDEVVEPFLESLRAIDAEAPQQGVRAFILDARPGM